MSTFSFNLEFLPGAGSDPRTMLWWEQFPEAWLASRSDPQPPVTARRAYGVWLATLPGTPLCVGWPAAWEFMWVYWYLIRYTEQRPFGECAIDSRSYAMAMRKAPFFKTGKNNLPKRWLEDRPHTHVALAEAMEQGV